MKRFIAIMLCAFALFSLCACGEETPEPTPAETEPVDTYSAVSFTNHGKQITVSELPEKVVTAGPHCTEIMCALGLSDFVIGKCMDNHSLGALETLSDDYYTIPDLCVGYPTYDELCSSGCDFLLTTDWIFGEDLTIKSLEKAGITVFVMDTDSISSLYSDLRTLAKIFEVPDSGDALIATDVSLIAAIKELIPEESLRVLVIDSFIGDKVYVTGSYGYENELISSAGGINVFAGLQKQWDAVTAAEVVASNPDFIIIHDYEGSAAEDKLTALSENEVLSALPCVQDGRIICISLENSFPGVRCGNTVATLARAMYPELFEDN